MKIEFIARKRIELNTKRLKTLRTFQPGAAESRFLAAFPPKDVHRSLLTFYRAVRKGTRTRYNMGLLPASNGSWLKLWKQFESMHRGDTDFEYNVSVKDPNGDGMAKPIDIAVAVFEGDRLAKLQIKSNAAALVRKAARRDLK